MNIKNNASINSIQNSNEFTTGIFDMMKPNPTAINIPIPMFDFSDAILF